MVPLDEQDRTLWDRHMLDKGLELVRACLRRNLPGPYQLQAAINAVHCDAATAAATDWVQILALYDQLLAVMPTPVVSLNRAVAVAEVDGPVAASSILDSLELTGYQPYHAARARSVAAPRPALRGHGGVRLRHLALHQHSRTSLSREPP